MAGSNYAQPSRTHFKPYIWRLTPKDYHKVDAGDENTSWIFIGRQDCIFTVD